MTASLLTICATESLRAEVSDTAIEEQIRSYILAHPELILEALEVLSRREIQAAVTTQISRYPDLFSEPGLPGMGPSNAMFTVVEFFDYRCAPCKLLHPKLKAALVDHPNIRLDMRHLPILSPGSERGARFALAVRNLASADVYRAVHNDIWLLKGPLRQAAFQQIAQKHSLKWDTIETEMNSDAVSARIARNRDIAIDLEILGTPAFVTPTSVSFGQTDAAVLIEGWLSQ